MTVEPAAGRRELNKARTRQALLDAVKELSRERGVDRVTVDDIADRAGVSRRTFFNYFAGIEGAVAEATAAPVQRLVEAFLRQPRAGDPLAAIIAAVRESPVDEGLLGWQPADPAAAEDAAGHRAHLRLWQHHEDWLAGVLAERLDDDDPLRARTLAATVMTLFETVERSWRVRSAGMSDADAVALFNADLTCALEHARAGWRTA
ncbi:TetR/AcrR family transcriptional regulator [Georgenia muralis]|uniref:TetR family transcriptional regulator n=1 Tax=Georgenia muralis TaxID=154117 RepID=A0A3N4ZA18_9MICO|nr:TetR/AcrR family transcriptional regulator [Georgenia muralis]RPF29097.1 TetR family transcriptional regulator [Georgenia muralis]